MNVVYRNEVYFLIEKDYTRPGFKHNFLLFKRDGEKRLAYSVQMAVNYIKELPEATFDQQVNEQDFVACIPLAEYTEIKEYLENGCKPFDVYRLAENQANNLIVLLTKLLNNDTGVRDKELLDKCEKLSQFEQLLELDNIDKPQAVFDFNELYHTYLNKQRVFKFSLTDKLKVRTLITDIEYLLRPISIQEYDRSELFSKYKELIQSLESIKSRRHSWLLAVQPKIESIKNRVESIR